MYYLLFTRQANLQLVWISHLLEARYFNQDELVQTPLQTVEGEAELEKHPYLSFATRQFLQQIRPAVEQGWVVLEEDPIDYAYNQKKHGLLRQDIQKAIEVCLRRVAELDGLAKFAALFYRSRRCPASERFDRLMAAKTQAEQVATSIHPEFSAGLFLWKIGKDLSVLGQKENAIAAYNQAIYYKPDYHQAWYNKGVALSALGHHEAAIAAYDQAIYYKADDYEAYYNKGIALSVLGQKEAAIAAYDQAIRFKSDYHQAHNNKGNVLSVLGQKEAAIAAYDQAIRFKSDYHQAHYNKGNALLDLGQKEAAIFAYDQALHHKPDYASAHYNKACYYALQGDVLEAVACLSKAIEFDPGYRELAKTDTDFDAIRDDDWFRAVLESE